MSRANPAAQTRPSVDESASRVAELMTCSRRCLTTFDSYSLRRFVAALAPRLLSELLKFRVLCVCVCYLSKEPVTFSVNIYFLFFISNDSERRSGRLKIYVFALTHLTAVVCVGELPCNGSRSEHHFSFVENSCFFKKFMDPRTVTLSHDLVLWISSLIYVPLYIFQVSKNSSRGQIPNEK